MANLSIFVSVLLLALFVKEGSCLHCYQCHSDQVESCGDPFNAPTDKYLIDCTRLDSMTYNQIYLRNILPSEFIRHVQGTPRFCHKIVLETGSIVRTCLDAKSYDIKYTCLVLENYYQPQKISTQFKIKQCSVCDKDNCNGASSISLSFPLATLALIGTYLICKQ